MGALIQPVTADVLEQMPESEGAFELIRGELIRMTPGNLTHSRLVVRMASRLNAYAEENDAGEVFAADVGFRLAEDPDTVLGPDIAFIVKDRLAGLPPFGFPRTHPDLAIEILSPSNTASEMLRKIEIYLGAGVKAVWIVDPMTQRAEIHSAEAVQRLDKTGALTEPGLLPGFRLALAELF